MTISNVFTSHAPSASATATEKPPKQKTAFGHYRVSEDSSNEPKIKIGPSNTNSNVWQVSRPLVSQILVTGYYFLMSLPTASATKNAINATGPQTGGGFIGPGAPSEDSTLATYACIAGGILAGSALAALGYRLCQDSRNNTSEAEQNREIQDTAIEVDQSQESTIEIEQSREHTHLM